jgi:NADH:ubiquinone oxidoreductase subunit E
MEDSITTTMTVDTHIEIKVCKGDRCKKNMSKYVFERASNELKIGEDEVSSDGVKLSKTNCLGMCKMGANVKIIDHTRNQTYILNAMDPITIAEAIAKIRNRKI